MPAGRPEKPINWNVVDEMIERQSTAAEIAGRFHMDSSTFYRKVQEKWETNFENYASSLSSKGKGDLREWQWNKAKEGNVQLLLKLGEIYLDQSEDKINSSNQHLTIKLIDARSHNTEEVQVPSLPG